jgi:hypothetical protein
MDNFLLTSSQYTKSPTIQTDTIDHWHRWWSHLNVHSLSLLAKDERLGMKIKEIKQLGFCEVCTFAKQTHMSFEPANWVTRPAFKILVDLAGGGKTLTDVEGLLMYGKAIYFIILTDEATWYWWGYLLKEKSEAAPTIKNWVKMIKASSNWRIGSIYSDGSGEFINQNLKNFYKEEGIQWQATGAGTPQSNEIAKRSN